MNGECKNTEGCAEKGGEIALKNGGFTACAFTITVGLGKGVELKWKENVIDGGSRSRRRREKRR